MGKLFENFEPYDVQATRREARAEGRAEGKAEGILEGKAKGKTEAILMPLEECSEVLDSWLKLAARTETNFLLSLLWRRKNAKRTDFNEYNILLNDKLALEQQNSEKAGDIVDRQQQRER